jgi:hypothetical protein
VGTAARAYVVLALIAGHAHADPCTGVTASGGRFATCFDIGNRLSLTAGSDGFGGALAIRHIVHFEDDKDLVWKLDHVIADSTYDAFTERFTGTLYRGHFLRHTTDGHIVLPFGIPKKIFLPFDIGGFAEAGALRWRSGDAAATLGMVKTGALIDLARSRAFRRRFAIGPVARWDVELARSPLAIAEHVVAPFSTAIASIHAESHDGITSWDASVEAGTAWHGDTGWAPEAEAEATLERIAFAINDRPIALVLGVRYESQTDETIGRIGARVVLVHRRDPRVSLQAAGAAGGRGM